MFDTTIHPDDSEHDELYKQACALLEGQLQIHNVVSKPISWLGRRRVKKAIALLKQVLEINPKNWAAMWIIGKAFQRLGQQEQGLGYFSAAHALAPDQPDVAREAGIAAMDVGKPELAVQFTARAIKANPNDPGLRANLALSHLFCGNPETAQSIIDDALSRDPTDLITQRIMIVVREVLSGKRACPHHTKEI